MRAVIPLLAAVALGPSTAAASEARDVITVKQLSLELAREIAGGALEACRADGWQVSVVVVDRGGAPQVVLRDAFAARQTIEIAERKANAAARHHLGLALLRARYPREAERVYREDLKRHPDNGWALYGLARSVRAQHRRREAREIEARFAQAWVEADVRLTESRY